MTAPTCPACGGAMDVFHRVEGVPVNSCLLVDDADAARGFPTGDLVLGHCAGCGFIANTAFDPGLTTYDPSYEETQGFSPRFRAFAADLAKQWVEDYDLHGRSVLEIGCGKAEFLALVAEAGGNDCTGIDPGVVPERAPAVERGSLNLVADLFDRRWTHLDPDAVICRHTLEHIAPVRELLDTVRATVRDGVPVLFELPDTTRVLREAAFEDVYYEHCSYFTAGSLRRLFRRCGFEVLQETLAYEGQYLLLEARPGTADDALTEADHADLAATAAEVASFASSFAATVDRWRGELQAASAAGERTVLWGGGSKAVAFLCALGLGDAVSAVVDINPHKQGKFLPGSGHPVVSPEDLVAAPPDLVVVMNAVYQAEITQMLGDLGLHPRVVSLGAPA
jgi:SAM-dependent methyltransferase